MKVLLPIDGSDCANKTLEWAAATFDPESTEYYLLNVIPVIPDLATVEFDVIGASTLLKKAKSLLQTKGCQMIHVDYQLGNTAEQICRYADATAVDQVVIGSHGRSGLAKLLMGSTGVAVLEHCNKPVIVYRNIERQSAHKPAEPILSSNTVL